MNVYESEFDEIFGGISWETCSSHSYIYSNENLTVGVITCIHLWRLDKWKIVRGINCFVNRECHHFKFQSDVRVCSMWDMTTIRSRWKTRRSRIKDPVVEIENYVILITIPIGKYNAIEIVGYISKLHFLFGSRPQICQQMVPGIFVSLFSFSITQLVLLVFLWLLKWIHFQSVVVFLLVDSFAWRGWGQGWIHVRAREGTCPPQILTLMYLYIMFQ